MKKVRYNGEHEQVLTTLGIQVNNGDVIPVPDEFEHPLFDTVEDKKVKVEPAKDSKEVGI
jgi:cupin superfamily acireductone dioxygenase involved in methionine salvage